MKGHAHITHECMCEVKWCGTKIDTKNDQECEVFGKMQVRHDSHMPERDVELHNVHDL